MKIVNVSGGYWTGSSAFVALLEEYDNISVCPVEYSAFGYGELFANLLEGEEVRIANSKKMFEEFNRTEKFRYLGSAIRLICRKLMIFPKVLFYPKAGGKDLFGPNYRAFCDSSYKGLFAQDRMTQKQSLKKFFNVLTEDSSIKNKENGIFILDQMISPSYIKHFNEFNDEMKHVVITRNWKDQYVEIREKLPAIVGKNIAIDVNPLNEGLTRVDTSIQMFAHIRKRFESDLNEISKLDNVLVLNFEDVVKDKVTAKNKLFAFLNISEGNWNEYSVFDERISVKNIDKWKSFNVQDEIDAIEEKLK